MKICFLPPIQMKVFCCLSIALKYLESLFIFVKSGDNFSKWRMEDELTT